jgi:hypothetical protein
MRRREERHSVGLNSAQDSGVSSASPSNEPHLSPTLLRQIRNELRQSVDELLLELDEGVRFPLTLLFLLLFLPLSFSLLNRKNFRRTLAFQTINVSRNVDESKQLNNRLVENNSLSLFFSID